MSFGTIAVRGLVVASALALSACATILNEETQQINVSASNGQPVKGTIDGQPFEGPGVVSVKRANADKIITTETAGCAETTTLNKQVDSKFFVNILSGGVFGSTTDYSTEKMWMYDENVVISCN